MWAKRGDIFIFKGSKNFYDSVESVVPVSCFIIKAELMGFSLHRVSDHVHPELRNER